MARASGKPAKPMRPGTNKPHSSPSKPPNRPKHKGFLLIMAGILVAVILNSIGIIHLW